MILEKIIRPNPSAISRLHDLDGNMSRAQFILMHLPKSIISFGLRLLKIVPQAPWISYAATKEIRSHLNKCANSAVVLEFGSGSSTHWFSKYSQQVYSMEHDEHWVNFVSSKVAQNVKLLHKTDEESYSNPPELRDVQGVDFILIDGPWRSSCFEHNIKRLKPTGWLYLDNSDAESSNGTLGELNELKNAMIAFAIENGRPYEIITDFAPCTLHATQGILIKNEKSD